MNALKNWEENTLHNKAQVLEKKWYKNNKLRICIIKRDYEFVKD